jgi:hypothetical protein
MDEPFERFDVMVQNVMLEDVPGVVSYVQELAEECARQAGYEPFGDIEIVTGLGRDANLSIARIMVRQR